MTTKEEWVKHCLHLACCSAEVWVDPRKILRERKIMFLCWDDSLQLEDIGFTPAKMRMLERGYINEESRAVAVELWARRRQKGKHGSVGFSTFNHAIKGGYASVEEADAKKSKHASVMGPCMQSVSITWMAKDDVAIDVFYRTTELFKKFPADLVFLRDVLLKPFDFSGMEITVTCHFANVTLSARYWVTVLANIADRANAMEVIRNKDAHYHGRVIRCTAEYLCPEKGTSIANHAQSLRVQKHALKSFNGHGLRELQEYLRKHQP
jgi:hypothetical protein